MSFDSIAVIVGFLGTIVAFVSVLLGLRRTDRQMELPRFASSLLQAPSIQEEIERAIVRPADMTTQGKPVLEESPEGIVVSIRTAGAEVDREKRTTIPYDVAYERMIGSTATLFSQLEATYRQAQELARTWFQFSLITAVVGFAFIVLGVTSVMFEQITTGVVAAVSGMIIETLSFLLFRRANTTNQQVDVIRTEIIFANELRTAFEIQATISDANARDALKETIIGRALRLRQGDRVQQKP